MQIKRQNLLLLALSMTFMVIVLGAYTRLKDAGLGCPDWPGCYGKLLAPSTNQPGISVEKAWIEMIHRYAAGLLGLLIFYLSATAAPKLRAVAVSTAALVILQALLGMWTVTMRLEPVIVMLHLLGGLGIFSLLWWQYLEQGSTKDNKLKMIDSRVIKTVSIISLAVVASQVALGGWTSANYAALVCADFPQCQGQWWPKLDLSQAFFQGGFELDNTARVTIQMLHRLGAAVTSIIILFLAWRLIQTAQSFYKRLGFILLSLLALQLTLGISNIFSGLNLTVALAHNAVAVLLLATSLKVAHAS